MPALNYDQINFLDPAEIIAGHNGQDGYHDVQRPRVLIHRRLPVVELTHILLPKFSRRIYAVETLVVDQYENFYYLMSAELSDGAVYTFCDRVRTNPDKKNYELDKGWDHAFEKYRAAGYDAIENELFAILGESN